MHANKDTFGRLPLRADLAHSKWSFNFSQATAVNENLLIAETSDKHRILICVH